MIKDVIEEIKEMCNVKPEFLRFSGNLIWDDIKNCNLILLKLITNKFLSEKSIEKIYNDYNDCINDLLDRCDEKLQLLICDYYITFLQYVQAVCLRDELYEALSNFKIYFDMFENNDI